MAVILMSEVNLCLTVIATSPPLPPCSAEVDDRTGLLNVGLTHRWRDGNKVLKSCRLCGKSRDELRRAARRAVR